MNRQITREGEMLRTARLKLGYSQQQVATMAGMQIRQYQRFEYGEREVWQNRSRAESWTPEMKDKAREKARRKNDGKNSD